MLARPAQLLLYTQTLVHPVVLTELGVCLVAQVALESMLKVTPTVYAQTVLLDTVHTLMEVGLAAMVFI
jgi:hypothetical protein